MYFYVIFLLINFCYSLSPSRLPNGNIKKYIPNKEFPHKDLRQIEKEKALLITKNWLENIVNNILANELATLKFFKETEDVHIITKITDLDKKIKKNYNKENICLAWMPKCIYGSDDVLSIILIENKDNESNVSKVIPSPFWNSEQINSFELKKSLIDYGENRSCNLYFTKLYEDDFRYQLSWSTWEL